MMQIPSFPLQRGLQLTGHVSATCGSFLKAGGGKTSSFTESAASAAKVALKTVQSPQKRCATQNQARHRVFSQPVRLGLPSSGTGSDVLPAADTSSSGMFQDRKSVV